MGENMDNETILLFKKLVYSIAKKYSYNKEDLEDLYQVGNIGLVNAINNYKKDSKAKFSTYAHFYIKGEILKYIRENKLIKTNYETDRLIRSINKVKEYLTQKMEREPSIYEISDYLNVSVNDIYDAISISSDVKSLDFNYGDDNETTLYDYETYIEKGYDEDILTLKEEISKLPSDERELLIHRFYEDKSQLETSKDLGISQVQVSRKETKILSKIKSNIMSKAA